MIFLRVFFIGIISFLCSTAQAAPESDFWKWFQKNEKMLFDFEKNQERTFDQLEKEMHKVDSTLTFEFGPKEGGKREFVISADGVKEAFPSVEKLYAAAPPLKKWKLTKFRPRREPYDITYQGVTVKADSVAVLIERDAGAAALTVLIPGYTSAQHETFVGITYLLLDQALGEFDVETRVGNIQVAAPSNEFARPVPLKNLAREFDALLAR